MFLKFMESRQGSNSSIGAARVAPAGMQRNDHKVLFKAPSCRSISYNAVGVFFSLRNLMGDRRMVLEADCTTPAEMSHEQLKGGRPKRVPFLSNICHGKV